MKHLMIDLETWGTRPGYMIRSLGAVFFDPETGHAGMDFYANFQENAVFLKDASTEAWWADQSAEVSRMLLDLQVSPLEALLKFSEFFDEGVGEDDADGVRIWSKGSMDEVMLVHYFRAFSMEEPWHFRSPRDMRVLQDLVGPMCPSVTFSGVPHYALDDCYHQIKEVHGMLRYLRVVGTRNAFEM